MRNKAEEQNIFNRNNQALVNKVKELKSYDIDLDIPNLTKEILRKKSASVLSNTRLKVLAKELLELSDRDFESAKSIYLYIYEI